MTMKKLANSMRSIFSFAIAQGYRFDNPADSKVLTSALPKVAKAEKHHEALPADQLADALGAGEGVQQRTGAVVRLCMSSGRR